MNIWAIADLHLSFGVANKKMDLFGAQWEDHPTRVAESWKRLIKPNDLVLIAGDISWAMTLEEAKADLEWIAALPGRKVMIRGNHDYWWPSLKKLEAHLPPTCYAIHNTALTLDDISIGGTRLWDSPEYSFGVLYDSFEPKKVAEEDEKIFERELLRLEMSLRALDPKASYRLVMTHYPPIGLDLSRSRVSDLLERYAVTACVFGHLHFPQKKECTLFGEARGVHYYLTASDYLQFEPLKILQN